MKITTQRLMELLFDLTEYAQNATLEVDHVPDFVTESERMCAEFHNGNLTVLQAESPFKPVAYISGHEKLMLDQGRTAMITPGNPLRAGNFGDILLYVKKP